MTRRVVPECKALYILRLWERNEGAVATGYEENTQSFRFDYCPDKKRRISIDHLNLIPSYKVGEVVAVAQKYQDFRWPAPQRSDFQEILHSAGWNNKMFVLADLMPHQIRITGIKVERLQDISDEDCMKEGIRKMTFDTFSFDSWKFFTHNPREAFAALIAKVSGKGIWESNPYVFAYEFELVK